MMFSDLATQFASRLADKVLILVLVDDVLWLLCIMQGLMQVTVLILVLVNDVLWPLQVSWLSLSYKGLNPCFSGWCSLTCTWMHYVILYHCLNPCFSGWCSLTCKTISSEHGSAVLILVLVDDVLWLTRKIR